MKFDSLLVSSDSCRRDKVSTASGKLNSCRGRASRFGAYRASQYGALIAPRCTGHAHSGLRWPANQKHCAWRGVYARSSSQRMTPSSTAQSSPTLLFQQLLARPAHAIPKSKQISNSSGKDPAPNAASCSRSCVSSGSKLRGRSWAVLDAPHDSPDRGPDWWDRPLPC